MSKMDDILDEALGILDPVEKAIAESAKTPPKIRPTRPSCGL